MRNFSARARSFALRVRNAETDRAIDANIEEFLNGQYHLAWFVDGGLAWVVKRLACCNLDHTAVLSGDALVLENVDFVAAGVVNRRVTRLGGGVVGWTSVPGKAEEE